MTKFADLHIHTHYSDGTDSPQDVVQQAIVKDLCCIGITDHDTLDGIKPTMDAASDYDLEVVPGIEFSTENYRLAVHILGYFIDYENPKIIDRLIKFQTARVDRIKKMIKKLKDQGVNNVTPDEVRELTLTDSVGRPHLATLLIEKGWVKDVREAFNRYLGEHCLSYVPKFKQTPIDAIELIHQAGGVAVLAHPMVTNIDELIPGFVKAGLDGLEAYYPNVSDALIVYYEKIAKKYDLVVTGGSDAHGGAKAHTYIGKQKIPYDMVERLKERAGV